MRLVVSQVLFYSLLQIELMQNEEVKLPSFGLVKGFAYGIIVTISGMKIPVLRLEEYKVKKTIAVLSILLLTISLTACGGVKQEEYDQLATEKATLQEEKEALQKSYEELQADYDQMSTELENVRSEYEAYQTKMKPYEQLSEEEAEAKRIEAEKVIQQQQEEEKKRQEAEAAEKAAKEAQGYETGITYDNIARNPDDYKGEKVKFWGKVIQVIEGDSTVQIRLAVNKSYDQIIFCEYNKTIVSSRVLEDDLITVYGTSAGVISYQSTGGGTITIPAVAVVRIDQ